MSDRRDTQLPLRGPLGPLPSSGGDDDVFEAMASIGEVPILVPGSVAGDQLQPVVPVVPR